MALIARNTRERSPVGKFILLSPSSVTRINDTGLDDVFTKFLNYTGGDSLNAIINDTFSSEAIIKANTKLLQEMYSDGSKVGSESHDSQFHASTCIRLTLWF